MKSGCHSKCRSDASDLWPWGGEWSKARFLSEMRKHALPPSISPQDQAGKGLQRKVSKVRYHFHLLLHREPIIDFQPIQSCREANEGFKTRLMLQAAPLEDPAPSTGPPPPKTSDPIPSSGSRSQGRSFFYNHFHPPDFLFLKFKYISVPQPDFIIILFASFHWGWPHPSIWPSPCQLAEFPLEVCVCLWSVWGYVNMSAAALRG